ncbi:uncharacterized protein LOC106082855 [Stomoxys calcitrans]|uniref:uncharacterized protein LOC106082855 n=1 Tax=Stomoxys calcitrans TaxID=35570 RepID=UPI0027E35E84|nr:uncharacterized protein LOC106082855 [Stomoxys calcitrans]
MGSRTSKIQDIDIDSMDPRSPSGCSRTPIQVPQSIPLVATDLKSNSENPLEVLRKRFFKGFTYNINDPRSPSLNLNRTPLIFEDSLERTLNLDDTFANLFASNNVLSVLPAGDCDDIEMAESSKSLPQPVQSAITPTSPTCDQKIDPRSPSIGIERTPIIFNDDDASEEFILENILSTLTLNLNESNKSNSIVSLSATEIQVPADEKKEATRRPTNRPLDRVRHGKKANAKSLSRRQKRVFCQRIYEDSENLSSTPHLKATNTNVDSPKGKRTPLGCIRNSSQARSRSVETAIRATKTPLRLQSFDDTLNPKENTKVSGINIISQDSVVL